LYDKSFSIVLFVHQFSVKVNNEWECVSEGDYQWNLLIERLEQLCHLNSTLKYCSEEASGTLYCIKYEYSPITLLDLLKLGRGNSTIPVLLVIICIKKYLVSVMLLLILGGVSTLVSKWLAGVGFDPTLITGEHLIDLDKKNQISPNKSKVVIGVQDGVAIITETAIEARVLSMTEKETMDALKHLKFCFPYSLENNILLANIFWEYSSFWQSFVYDIRPLNAALNVADKIPCPHIRQSESIFSLLYRVMIIIIINH